MEVVAGVASVTGVVGILGVVGHAIQGVLELKKFAHSVSTASKTVENFLEAIESLEGALTAISDFLKRAPEAWLVGAEAQNIKRLASQVTKCGDDIEEWLKEVPVHDANFSKSTRSLFRKLSVASNTHAYRNLHQSVSLHCQRMQMSLNLLGCSYDLYILEQGNAIAGQVQTATEAQSGFHQVSMEEFGKIDDSFVTRLNPISSQLDRLENSSQKSEASMSSIASDVSRVLEILSSSSARATSANQGGGQTDASSAGSARAKMKHDPSKLSQRYQQKARVQWSCDFLPGIEDAFSASGQTCLYCGDKFDADSTEWFIKGRHLADEHRYGDCNLLISYDSEEVFHRHIQEFHECSNYLSHDFLDNHRQKGRERGFHRGLRSKRQHLTDDFHSIRSRRLGALFADNRWFEEMHTQPCDARPTSSTKIVEKSHPAQGPWELDLSAAIRDESCIVDGLLVASAVRLWSISNHCAGDMKKPYYSLGDGIKVSRYEFASRNGLAFGASSFLHAHKRKEEPALGNAEVARERNRINAWLREVLMSSITIKAIVYHTIGKDSIHSPNMNTWLETTLRLWDLDEAAKEMDGPDNYSDGALDSRGSPEIRNITDHKSATDFHMSQAQQYEMIDK